MIKKYGVFNPLDGMYTFLSNKEDVAEEIVKTALNLYYFQCNGGHFYEANVDENGHKKFNKMKTAGVIILIICLLSIVITLLNPYENLPIKHSP